MIENFNRVSYELYVINNSLWWHVEPLLSTDAQKAIMALDFIIILYTNEKFKTPFKLAVVWVYMKFL